LALVNFTTTAIVDALETALLLAEIFARTRTALARVRFVVANIRHVAHGVDAALCRFAFERRARPWHVNLNDAQLLVIVARRTFGALVIVDVTE
jgi:hypothetical protein